MSDHEPYSIGSRLAAPGEEPALGRPPGRGDLWLLLAIAGPNVATTIAQSLMSIVDYVIVSQLPNASEAQAAVSCAGMIFFSIFAMLLGTMICVTTVVSQSLGAGRYRDCSAYAWQGIWLSAAVTVIGVILWPIMPGLYRLIGHAPAVQIMEADYTQIRLLSVGAAGATVAMANFFNGIHRPGVNAVSVVMANILNGVLSYGLVLGKWGLPAMGVAGAAWGSLIATVFRTAWLMWMMCLGQVAARFQPLHTWRFDGEKMRRLVRVGWPAGVALTVDIAAWTFFMTMLIGQFGTIHLAATATVWRFLELSFMPAIGIGAAVSTVVGRAIGQGRPDRARRLATLGARINVVYMSLMGATYITCGTVLMRLLSRDDVVIALGAQLLIFAAVFQFFDAFAITYNSALRGAGDTLWPAVMGALEAWTIMIGGSAVMIRLHPELGSKGPWAFCTAFIICIGLTLWIRWRRGRWEALDVIGRTEPAGADLEVASAEADEPVGLAGEPEHVGTGPG